MQASLASYLSSEQLEDVLYGAIVLCNDVLNNETAILDKLFGSHLIRHQVILDHIGLLTPVCSEGEINAFLARVGYVVVDRFPSVVVTGYVRTVCASPDLKVNITKATHKDKPNISIELFTPSFAPAHHCWLRVAQEINHIAFRPCQAVSFSTLCNGVKECGLTPSINGINPYAHDLNLASTAGVTVKYYKPPIELLGALNVEICTSVDLAINQDMESTAKAAS